MSFKLWHWPFLLFVGLYVVFTILLGMLMTLIVLCQPRKPAWCCNSVRRDGMEEMRLQESNDRNKYGTGDQDGNVRLQNGRSKQYSKGCSVCCFVLITFLWAIVSTLLSWIMFKREWGYLFLKQSLYSISVLVGNLTIYSLYPIYLQSVCLVYIVLQLRNELEYTYTGMLEETNPVVLHWRIVETYFLISSVK